MFRGCVQEIPESTSFSYLDRKYIPFYQSEPRKLFRRRLVEQNSDVVYSTCHPSFSIIILVRENLYSSGNI